MYLRILTVPAIEKIIVPKKIVRKSVVSTSKIVDNKKRKVSENDIEIVDLDGNDGEEFVFILSATEGNVAMLLITNNDELYINEKAREQLKVFFKTSYKQNIEMLLPKIASELSKGILSVNGVKYP